MDKLTTGRYKTCGHGHPYYNQEGEFDEVTCDLIKEYFCGEGICPLDKIDEAEQRRENAMPSM